MTWIFQARRVARIGLVLSLLSVTAGISCGGSLVPMEIDAALVDASIDALPDGAPVRDSGGDAPYVSDAPIPDTGSPLNVTCAANGGLLCTPARWTVCPSGFEPIAQANGRADCNGYCCQREVSPSNCSAEGDSNCLQGSCNGCWQRNANAGLSCESGRVCCAYVCDSAKEH